MVSMEELLNVYNENNNTSYASIKELGTALTKHALNMTWTEHKKQQAAILAEAEINTM